jgi:hypothetical protein
MAGSAKSTLQSKAMEIDKTTRMVALNMTKCEASVVAMKSGDVIGNVGTQLEHGLSRNDDGSFSAFLGAELDCFAQKEPERLIGKIACTFASKYMPAEQGWLATKTDEDLMVFVVLVSPLHLWPYIREFSQSVAQRMMMPPLLLPAMGRITNTDPEDAARSALAMMVAKPKKS